MSVSISRPCLHQVANLRIRAVRVHCRQSRLGRKKSSEERMSRLAGLLAFAAAASCMLWSQPPLAQEPYPSRTVKIVVPAVPGSTTDTLARIVADQLGQKWGKPTIVENIPGGAMNIGAGNVARAAPDGY